MCLTLIHLITINTHDIAKDTYNYLHVTSFSTKDKSIAISMLKRFRENSGHMSVCLSCSSVSRLINGGRYRSLTGAPGGRTEEQLLLRITGSRKWDVFL